MLLMKATETQEQIAKELCLKLIEHNFFAAPTSIDGTYDEFNSTVGKQIGITYQAILSEIVKSTE